MRVLLLIQYYFPKTQSCVQLMRDLALELRDQGHEVTLVAPDDTLEHRLQITDEDGVTIVRVRSRPFRGVTLPMRAWNEFRLPSTLWRAGKDFFREHPCDIIVSYSPPVLLVPLVRRLKRLWGCTNYLVLRDIFPQWAVDAGVIRAGGIAHRIFEHYEQQQYQVADAVGVMSKGNLEYFAEKKLESRCHVEVLYNWARCRGVPITKTRYREKLGLDNKVVFLYGGNLGVAQDLGKILALADALRDEPDVFFLLVGDGSEAQTLEAEAKQLRLDNLAFSPPVDHATYLGMVAEFDVGLVTLSRDLTTHNFPSKMHDFMYCSKPILASVNPGNDLKDLLADKQAGLACWAGDDETLRQLCLRLARDGTLRHRLGANGRRVLEQLFSPEQAVRQILAYAPPGRKRLSPSVATTSTAPSKAD